MERTLFHPRRGEFLLVSKTDAHQVVRATDNWPALCHTRQLLLDTVSQSLGAVIEHGFTPLQERGSRVCRAGSALRIRHLLDARIAELEPSERHRVELLCGLVYAPTLLFVEEPPLHSRERVAAVFRRFQAEFGVTTLWATYDPEPLLPLADRMLVFEAGGVRIWDVPHYQPLGDLACGR